MVSSSGQWLGRAMVAAALCAAAAPVRAEIGTSAKALAPIPAATLSLMAARDTAPGSPILMRAFKKEGDLEIWKRARSGRYVLLKIFPICRWSGQLGPKQRQGDRQTPEGFYPITPRQLNPNSSYHLSFDLGFPNAYDRAHGASGSYLMVHGICSSMGCFAMTNAQIQEIYALSREAFLGGQRAFQFQSYPFRMTARNMARARQERHFNFWRQLKEGYDRFEATGEEPGVDVAGGRYVFAPSRDPGREALAQARLKEESLKIAKLVEDGSAAVRITYSDGGQNHAFAALTRAGGADLGGVSRPEALASAGREIVLIPEHRKRPTAVAARKPDPAATASLGVSSARPPLGVSSASLALVFRPSLLGEAAGSRDAPAVLAGAVHILPASLTMRSAEVLARR